MSSPTLSRAPAAGAQEALSAREREVAGLVSQGLTNAVIGQTLHLSPWTVGTHVAHILGKLGFRSRAQIAAWYLSEPADEPDERERLQALRYYQILDSDPEPSFDRITALTAKLFRAPISLITFVDERRQWFKSAHGVSLRETPREGGFCAYAIACEAPTMIADARLIQEFSTHSMVTGPPGIRLYAGAPLTTADGHHLGTLCVIDTEPRSLSPEELDVLADLAGLVMGQLERRMADIRLSESERMRREAQRYAQRMGELERMKSEFLDLASHELRAPLTVLNGYTSMIADGSLGAVSPEVQSVLRVMSDRARLMEELINQMLESARLEDVRQTPRVQFDLRAVLETVWAQLERPPGGSHTLELRLPDESVDVTSDRDQVATILTNLLDNALKFSPDGGLIKCTLSRGAVARIEVEDQGLGIDERDLPRLFQRFGRLVTPANSHIHGCGLGLYLARELARRMGGDVMATSRLGEGSRFTLTLPAA